MRFGPEPEPARHVGLDKNDLLMEVAFGETGHSAAPPHKQTPYCGSPCYEAFATIRPKSIAFGSTNSPVT